MNRQPKDSSDPERRLTGLTEPSLMCEIVAEPMPFLDVMHAYFRGERIEALYFIVPIGLLMVAFAAVGLRTAGQVAEIEAGFLIDGFAERRARPYTQALKVLAAEQDVELQAE